MAADGDIASLKTRGVPLSVGRELYLPSTRYCGSKRRLADWLRKKFDAYEFSSVLDAFGGTATVSMIFLQMGKNVTFHDGFSFNEISARALMEGRKESFYKKDFLEFLQSIDEVDGFISQNFKGMYYLDEENRWLDGLQVKLKKMPQDQIDIVLYCAFQACLQKRPYNMFHRANLNLRTKKNISRTFGNLTTWGRSFEELMARAFDELSTARQSFVSTAIVHKPSALMNLPTDFDFVYLDPPYLRKKKGEDYLYRYHFLEGMAKYDLWPNMIDRHSQLKIIKEPYLPENWEDRGEILSKIDALVYKFRKSSVALSYMTGGVPELIDLKKIFQKYFVSVRVYKMPFGYALSRRDVSEILIVGEPQ